MYVLLGEKLNIITHRKTMKKTYMKPELSVVRVESQSMLADSVNVYDDAPVDGSQAITKEDNGWDIWGD